VRQKDRDARWTKKHGRSFFGYKNHVNADAKHKLIRHYAVTDAAVHDSQELDGLLDEGNTCNDVFADSAYRSAEIEAKLRSSGYKSRIHRRGRRIASLGLRSSASEPLPVSISVNVPDGIIIRGEIRAKLGSDVLVKACKIALLSNLDRRIHNPLGSELVESLPASRFRLTGNRWKIGGRRCQNGQPVCPPCSRSFSSL
jgi:hypothetical protein